MCVYRFASGYCVHLWVFWSYFSGLCPLIETLKKFTRPTPKKAFGTPIELPA